MATQTGLCFGPRFIVSSEGLALGGDGVCTHVNSRRKALLYRDSNLQPDLSLDYKPSTLTYCVIGSIILVSKKTKVNVGIIVQLSKDLMDWVSRRLCYAVGDTDKSVCLGPRFIVSSEGLALGGDGVCTHVNSRRKALLCRDSNLQPDLSLNYKPSTAQPSLVGNVSFLLCSMLV